MFCRTLLYVLSSIAIILMGKRELIVLLNLSPLCLMMVEWLFLAVPWGCLLFLIVLFHDHTHLLVLSLYKFILLGTSPKNIIQIYLSTTYRHHNKRIGVRHLFRS